MTENDYNNDENSHNSSEINNSNSVNDTYKHDEDFASQINQSDTDLHNNENVYDNKDSQKKDQAFIQDENNWQNFSYSNDEKEQQNQHDTHGVQDLGYTLAPEYGAYIPRQQRQYGESYITSAQGDKEEQIQRNNSQNATSSTLYGNNQYSSDNNSKDSHNPDISGTIRNIGDQGSQSQRQYPLQASSERSDQSQVQQTQQFPQYISQQEQPLPPNVPAKYQFENPYEMEQDTSEPTLYEHNNDFRNGQAESYPMLARKNNGRTDNVNEYISKQDLYDYENRVNAKARRMCVRYSLVASIITIILVIAMGSYALNEGYINLPNTGNNIATIPTSTKKSGTVKIEGSGAPDWKNVVKKVSGSVVSIQTNTINGVAKGSGLIIDKKGHVVTNNHVIEGAKSIIVTTVDGQMSNATIVGFDRSTDLAVLKLDHISSVVKTGEFADSDDLAVGQPIMAIGNPLGYDDTATVGIVSAVNRPVAVMDREQKTQIVTNAVQIDASINPGNSGGPTFDAAGRVIGINSSIVSTAREQSQAGSIGIGFAIPSNLVKRITGEILKHGSAQHVLLGATITNATVQVDGITRSGAQIVQTPTGNSIVPDSPAQQAGLRAGDTIIDFNKLEVTSSYSLLGFVRAAALGDRAVLTIVRNNHIMNVEVHFTAKESSIIRNDNLRNNDNNPNDRDNQNNNDNQDQNKKHHDGDDDDDDGLFDPFGLW